MKIIKEILKNSTISTVKTLKILVKVIIPVIFIITFIDMTGVLSKFSTWLDPVMKIFNLPGEASLALILGNVVNLYAAISVIVTLDLSSSQITTIAIMLLFSHSLVLETSIIAAIGVKRSTQLAIRILTMILIGITIGLLIGVIYG